LDVRMVAMRAELWAAHWKLCWAASKDNLMVDCSVVMSVDCSAGYWTARLAVKTVERWVDSRADPRANKSVASKADSRVGS
jgi:hypothetical protein